MNGFAYARYSSDNQRSESIDAQLRAIREYAAQSGITIIREYVDEAMSGTSDNRPAFQRMMDDARGGEVDLVIVHKLDRFARDRYDSAHYKRILRKHRVKVYSVTEKLDGSPESAIMESVLEGMAQYYSENLSREVKKGLKENVLSGRITGGKPPLGYKVNERKEYEIDPIEADTVRTIFQMYADGASYGDIIQAMADKGRITKTGRPFGKNSLHDLLVNDKYVGILRLGRFERSETGGPTRIERPAEEQIVIEGGIPAIVDRPLWDRVQHRMKENKHASTPKHARRVYLLSGIVECGVCGAPIQGKSTQNKNGTHHYTYYCQERRKNRNACSLPSISSSRVEKPILEELRKRMIVPRETLRAAIAQKIEKMKNEDPDTLSEMRRRRSELRKQIDMAVEAVIAGLNSPALAEKLTRMEAELRDISETIEELEKSVLASGIDLDIVTDKVKQQYDAALFRLDSGDPKALQSAVRLYIEKVTLYPDHMVAWYRGEEGQQSVLMVPPWAILQYGRKRGAM